MTKAGLAKAVYNKIGFSKAFSKELVDELFRLIKSHLMSGQGIKIQGFGKFLLKDKKQRKGRNPKTGKALTISARRVLLFQASETFKKKF